MIACIALAWVLSAWLLFVVEDTAAVGGSVRTTFGVSRWIDVVDGKPVFFGRLLTPGNGLTPRVHPARTIVAGTFGLGLTVFLALFARRELSNLLPRTRCGHCGYRIADSSHETNLCPECGKLPNLKREPWAVWRS